MHRNFLFTVALCVLHMCNARTYCSGSPDTDTCLFPVLCSAHNRKQLEELRATLSHQLITPTLFGTRAITAASLAHLVPLLVQVYSL
jgi:hypothetical protein